MRRMRVKQADPEIALERIEFTQQGADGCRTGEKRLGGGGKFFGRRNRAALASATTSFCVRLRCEPRIRGMMQKLHGWLQPSAIFK
jgi:hypothetical protein